MRGNATLTTDSSTKAIVEASTAQMSTQRFWCESVDMEGKRTRLSYTTATPCAEAAPYSDLVAC
jgi:hypothetical protein